MIAPRILTIALSLTLAMAHQSRASHELEGGDIALGAAIYAGHCASCHGADLEGQPDWRSRNADGTLPAPPHDATGHTWHHDNALLFEYTRMGGAGALARRGVTGFNSAMPAFAEILSDDQIWDVLAYIRSTWPDRIKAAQAARNQQH